MSAKEPGTEKPAAEYPACGKRAALLIAHGSRRDAANHDLVELAEVLRARALYPIVEIAYLELAQPTIPDGGLACIRQGADYVFLLPYFLSAGAHVTEDLERFRRELAAQFPLARFILCKALSLHPLLIDIVIDRLAEAEHAQHG
jgi:sirohydrochlorin ferrochelatase